MSTRCLIGQKREDGIHSFYCHCDGYPEYVGFALTHFYDSEELATRLVDFCKSGTSALGINLEETKQYLYMEGNSRPVDANSREYEKNAGFCIEYIYLWSKGSWRIYKYGAFRDIKKYEPRASKNIYFKKQVNF